MKKSLKVLWRIGCIVLAVVFLFSCFTQLIPARVFSFTVFFALLFPYLFLLVFLVAVIYLYLNKKWSLFFFILLIPGLYNFFHVVAISPSVSWKMEKDTASTRIMTWNVSDFVNPAPLDLPDAKERREILNTISQYNPDIICIQEYYNADSSRDLPSEKHELDSLGYKYLIFSNDQRLETFFGIIERGVAIASKIPFLDSGHLQIRSDYHPEFLVYADIMIHEKPVRINTAHLMSYYLFPDSAKGYGGRKNVAKKIYTYKRDVEAKLRDVEKFHDKQAIQISTFLATSPYPIVYCGDCNATSAMYSYRTLRGDKQDAFLKGGNGIGATFYNIVPTLRIDMCFPDNNFTVEQCTVVQRKLGDHYPVVADVKWKEP